MTETTNHGGRDNHPDGIRGGTVGRPYYGHLREMPKRRTQHRTGRDPMTTHEWREPAGRRTILLVGQRLHWSYANLAIAHAALNKGASKYGPFPHFQIRAKLYAGLNAGTMSVGGLYDDERLKLLSPGRCAYCGQGATTADHLLPRATGGGDFGENLVPACRGCNSAKGARDVMAWHRARASFPSLSVTRRYLKLSILAASEAGLMSLPWTSPELSILPFDVASVPMNFPAPSDLVWEIGAA